MKNNICILYSAHGADYIKDAENCARYSKKFIPKNCDLVFNTNIKYKNEEKIFNHVIYEKNTFSEDKSHAFKIQAMITILKNKNYEKILFIDSDALICKKEFMIPFDMLTEYDILGVTANVKYGPSSKEIDKLGKFTKIPRDFSEINTGVLYFNNTETIQKLMINWLNFYVNNYKINLDQGAFRYCLYTMHIKFKKIKKNFNWRKRDVDGNTIILHHARRVRKYLSNMDCNIKFGEQ